MEARGGISLGNADESLYTTALLSIKRSKDAIPDTGMEYPLRSPDELDSGGDSALYQPDYLPGYNNLLLAMKANAGISNVWESDGFIGEMSAGADAYYHFISDTHYEDSGYRAAYLSASLPVYRTLGGQRLVLPDFNAYTNGLSTASHNLKLRARGGMVMLEHFSLSAGAEYWYYAHSGELLDALNRSVSYITLSGEAAYTPSDGLAAYLYGMHRAAFFDNSSLNQGFSKIGAGIDYSFSEAISLAMSYEHGASIFADADFALNNLNYRNTAYARFACEVRGRFSFNAMDTTAAGEADGIPQAEGAQADDEHEEAL
jgi:hypothetical protein